jgi:NAD(P)-dependent dehydrogenase (short-subunit alcohol dehydrogenase family)
MEELVAQTVQEYGRLDLMINNAGIGLDGELIDTSHEQFARVMDINFWGVYYGTMAAYPVMIRQGHGQIVNVSSLAGLLPGGLMASYVASKHAVTGFTLSLRGEAKQYGVKANALCPGFIETELHDTTEIVTEYVHAQAQQRKKTQFPTAAACIPLMMKGIVKNRAIIISPRSHRMYWWINRLVPSFIPWMWSKIIAEICKNPSRQVISGRPTHNLYSPEPTRRCDLQ